MSTPLILIIAGGLAALGCLFGAFHMVRRKRLIDDMPTSRTQGVFIGLVELKGTAESDSPLTSYLAGTRCVQYSWQVDEHWSRTVTETYTDAKGHTQTRTKTESGWKRVDGGGKAIPFYLKDDTGVIRVAPDGAKLENIKVFDETCSPGNPLYYGKGPAGAVANSTHRRRFHETALPLHAELYVAGQAREREDVVAPEIARDKDSPIFVISVHSEKKISGRYSFWVWFWTVLGLAVAAGVAGTGGRLQNVNAGLTWQPYLAAAGGFIAAGAVGWLWTVYNSLINLHHRVEQGWSQVDVQLKRRHDLIPNLVKTVEGYGSHERAVQQLLTEIRRQENATPPGVAGPDFKGITPLLLGVVERYPDLKAGESFLSLQKTLGDTEQRIALARGYFNDIATFYNTRLQIIPDRFVAAIARLRPQALLNAEAFERIPVRVKLAD